jgi:hypothetical protein
MTSVLYSIVSAGTPGLNNGTFFLIVPLTGSIATAVNVGGYLIPADGNNISSAVLDTYSGTWAAGDSGSAPDGGSGSFISSCYFPFLGSTYQYIEDSMNVSLLFGGVPPGTSCMGILWAQLP